MSTTQFNDKQAAIAKLGITQFYRNNIGAWFKRYGVLKDKGGQELRYDPATCTGGPTPTAVQKKMFDEYNRCRKLKIPCKMMVLKPRQNGASTAAQAIMYFHLRSFVGRKGALMADIQGSGDKVFEHFRNFAAADEFDWGDGYGRLKPDGNLTDDITLPGGSTYIKVTAGSTNAGRGGTVQAMNMTEVAFFPQNPDRDPALGFLGSWNKDGESSVGIMDSTPNGPAGTFYSYWSDTKNKFTKIFVAWFEEPTYAIPFADEVERRQFEAEMDEDEREERERFGCSLEQLKWRRQCIHDNCGGDLDKFRQEYPSDANDCLSANMRVGTSRGMVRICDVNEGDVTDFGIVSAKASKGVRPVFDVITKRGHSFRATSEHRVSTGAEFTPVSQLLGKAVTLQPPMLAGEVFVARWAGFAGVEQALKITEDWGAFLGYFMGDGCVHRDALSLICAARDQDLVQDIPALVKRTLGLTVASRVVGMNGGAIEWRAASNRLAPLLTAIGCAEDGGRKICIPDCIWRSPRPVVRQFLRYLFEADGWASMTNPVVKFFAKEREFTREVQRMLLAFGVLSTIRKVIRATNGKEYPGHELSIGARSAAVFMREVGFVSARKNSGFAARYNEKNSDKRSPGQEWTDVVVSVEPVGEEEVWDLQIDGKPMFSANGILVHNCFLRKSRARFSVSIIEKMEQAAAVHPPTRGSLSENGGEVGFNPDEGGSILVYERPRYHCRYIIGFDSCTGRDQHVGNKKADPDEHSIKVWREGYVEPSGQMWAPKLVAVHSSQLESETATSIAAQLSRWYGKCMVVPEVNGCGLYPTKKLIELGVPVYYRQSQNSASRTMEGMAGWNTNEQTRKEIIDHLGALISKWTPEKPTLEIWDAKTLHQYKKFAVNRAGRPEAMPGEHDDAVMADAIALYNIASATENKPPVRKKVDLNKMFKREGWSAPAF
jgi:hypothetical protein